MPTTNFEAKSVWDITPIGEMVDQPESRSSTSLICKDCSLHLVTTDKDAILTCFNSEINQTCMAVYLSGSKCDVSRMGNSNVIISTSQSDGSTFSTYLVKFAEVEVRDNFCHALWNLNKSELIAVRPSEKSLFNSRTDDASASQYFQFYGYLSQQQNMMQDYIRTATYQRAIHENYPRILDKVVLDVGAGSGILSFFAIQAGAKKVYAVEASSVAVHAAQLVRTNGLADKIEVLCGKIEEIELPEQVDVIISEPMGYMLFNERMLETFLHAKKWLKPGGSILPETASLYIAPFSDEALYLEQIAKSNFWLQTSFYGVDLSCMKDEAVSEYFKQPIVDTFDPRICLTKPFRYNVNFVSAKESDLYEMVINADFGYVNYGGIVHGCAFWFDVSFPGSKGEPIWLSTAPSEPLTHWYQVRCLLQKPILVTQTQQLVGEFTFKCNCRQSYDIHMKLAVKGTDIKSENILDLKNPYFRYTGQVPIPPPPGQAQNESPTEHYYSSGSYGQVNNPSLNNNYYNYQQQQQQPIPVTNSSAGGQSSSNCNINNSVDAAHILSDSSLDNFDQIPFTQPDNFIIDNQEQ